MAYNEEDESRGMDFSTEADFEGGQWIGGEFYAGTLSPPPSSSSSLLYSD